MESFRDYSDGVEFDPRNTSLRELTLGDRDSIDGLLDMGYPTSKDRHSSSFKSKMQTATDAGNVFERRQTRR